MTISLEVRTKHADIGEVVRELAPRVDDVSIRLSSEKSIPDGEWVRFTVHLRDGSVVFEGVGRSQGAKPEGRRFNVMLSLLQFDERNEIMYERMLLARDAGEGESTGTIDISELAEIERSARRPAPPPLPPPRKSSLPPVATQITPRPSSIPSPPRMPSVRPPAPSSPPPKRTTDRAPPPRPIERPAPKRDEPRRNPAAARPIEPTAKRAPIERPKAEPPKPAPPPAVEAPKPVEPPRPIDPPKPIEPPRAEPVSEDRAPRKKKKPMRIPVDEPADIGMFDTQISRPDDLAFRSQDELRLVVAPRLVARARALAPNLPDEVLDRKLSPEEGVLQAAIRIGLASLAALADVDDDA
jgi:hypothetical protein